MPSPGNPSPLVEYGDAPGTAATSTSSRNQWSFYGPFMTYALAGEGASRVSLGLGPTPDPEGLIADLRELIGSEPPCAAQSFTSAPVASECRGVFPVPV